VSIEEEWEQFDVRQVFDVLSTRDTGLTADEVAKRLEEYGANHIYRKRKAFKSPSKFGSPSSTNGITSCWLIIQ